MKKPVDKKIIQEAIKSTLNKSLIAEGPLDLGVFDAPARGVGAVKNMFANIGGQMKLGAINKQLDRSAKRIEGEWDKAEETMAKLATKMQSSKNPNIKNSGDKVAKNIQGASSDIRNATNKLRSMSSLGADKEDNKQNGEDDDFKTRTITTKSGNKKIETPVERWAISMGVDYKDLGNTEKNHMNKLFMDIQNAGINPFKIKISKDKQELLLNYSRYRNKQIQKTGRDPFPDYEHFEKVLGKKFADEMRKSGKPEKEVATPEMSPDAQKSEPQQLSQDVADKQSSASEKQESEPTEQEFDINSVASRYAQEQGFTPEMAEKWMAFIQNRVPSLPQEDDTQELDDKDLEPVSKTPPPIPQAAKDQSKADPIPLVSKKQPQIPAVKTSPIKAIGTPEQPSVETPRRKEGQPVQLPKLTDFFGDKPSASLPSSTSTETPPQQQENEPEKELSLQSAMSSNPPVKDTGSEVQVGDVQQPAFQPPPESATKPRKKPSSKKKRSKV